MEELLSQQSPEILNIKPDPNPNVQNIPQKFVQVFKKRFADLIKQESLLKIKDKNILEIIDQGSKGNQRLFCKKNEQTTVLQVCFQQEQDYYRQKILLKSLEKDENKTTNGFVTKYPTLKQFDDEKLALEMDLGYVSLQKLKEIRQKKGYIWHDKEIQFLMKQISKIIFQLYNNSLYHGNISPANIFLRKNVLGFFEPVLVDFMDATNDYQKVNNFNPDYWSYQNEEYQIFNTKEERLKHELYMVGRTIQRLMIDLDSKHEANLYNNQTNVGIQRCMSYFEKQKNTQFSQKTLDCLSILLKKGNIKILVKKFKKFNKQQMLIDSEKYTQEIFANMCLTHPPIEFIKRVKNITHNNNSNFTLHAKSDNSQNKLFESFQSTQESENQSEDEQSFYSSDGQLVFLKIKNTKQFQDKVNQEISKQIALAKLKHLEYEEQEEEMKKQLQKQQLIKKEEVQPQQVQTDKKTSTSSSSEQEEQQEQQEEQLKLDQQKPEDIDNNNEENVNNNDNIDNQKIEENQVISDSDSEWDFIDGLEHQSDIDDSFEAL